MSKFYVVQFALFIFISCASIVIHGSSLPRTMSFSVRASHAISISQFKGNVIFKKSVLENSENVMRAGNVLVRFRILFFVRASREGSVLLVLAHADRHSSEDTDVSHYVRRPDLRSVPGQLTL